MAIDLSRITAIHLALLAIAAAACMALGRGQVAGIVLGGAVMALNVWLLKWVTGVLVAGGKDGEGSGKRGLAVFGFVLHFGMFLGLAAALFWRLPIDAPSFAVGVTILLIACVIEAVRVGRVAAAARHQQA